MRRFKSLLPLFAIAVRNAMANARARKHAMLSRGFMTITKALKPGQLELPRIVGVWAQCARELLNADRCTLFLYDGRDDAPLRAQVPK